MIIPSVVMDQILEKLKNLLKEEAFMLWGATDGLMRLQNKLKMTSAVLQDAENKELKESAVRLWLEKLRDVMYDINDIIDDFNLYLHNNNASHNQHGFASTIISSFNKCFEIISELLHLNFHRHDIGERIKAIDKRLEEINGDITQLSLVRSLPNNGSSAPQPFQLSPSTSFFIESEVFGIDEDTDSLVQALLKPNTEKWGVTAIVGMGGIGKTTLTQKVYHKSNFVHKIWVCVSQNYNEIDVVKHVVKSAGGDHQQTKTMEELYAMMRNVLLGKHVLLVLDDLWSDRVWNEVLRVPFQNFTADTRVLITTRDEGIARQMKAVYKHEVKVLPDEDAWSLLRTVVRRQGNVEEIEELKDIGMKIVKECKGLPLAIKVIGGVLSKKKLVEREWRTVLSSDLWSSRDASTIMSALRLSYMDLPSELKPCFLTYSLFPEDYVISRTRVTRMWVAEGLVKETDGDEQQLEDFAGSYHDELVSRSLLQVVRFSVDPQDDDMNCKMHDLVRELAISMTRGEHIVGGERQQDRQQESMKVRRLSIFSVKEMKEIPERIKNEKCRLRSLLVFQSKGMKVIPENLYDNLKFLHVLDLSNACFEYLPDSIGELVHLRYLNLYNTGIVELPNSICNLWQVQTLILLKSMNITKIPKDLSQMQELRHLEVDGRVDIPEGIGKLTNLRTLRDFTVRNRSGRCNMKS
ncbi:putative disease resistance RPP13-like protein 3 [Acorus calamus]|uniref:Disease resistance RPP13-like protein 3 n=1 Tax=Acorus calamus TaxID=4465 RepID=A0AAV9D551_ACOCL|nr:putative disease resistance RPP13-like protein 3 [Acorus calamus]